MATRKKKTKKITRREKTRRAKELKRKKEREFKKRSAAARKGWETRRKQEAAQKRLLRKKVAPRKKAPRKLPKKPVKKKPSKPAKKPAKPERPKPRKRVTKLVKKLIEAKPTPEEIKPVVEIIYPDRTTVEINLAWLENRLNIFADRDEFSVRIHKTILADGTGVIEAIFDERKNHDWLLARLSEEVQSWGPGYKISIAVQIDPSKIVKPHEFSGVDKIDIGKNSYDYYKGMLDVPTNFSAYSVGQFANLRFTMLPALRDTAGTSPSAIRLVVLTGDSIMGTSISRKLSHKLDLFGE